jgi:hypothetical protein
MVNEFLVSNIAEILSSNESIACRWGPADAGGIWLGCGGGATLKPNV